MHKKTYTLHANRYKCQKHWNIPHVLIKVCSFILRKGLKTKIESACHQHRCFCTLDPFNSNESNYGMEVTFCSINLYKIINYIGFYTLYRTLVAIVSFYFLNLIIVDRILCVNCAFMGNMCLCSSLYRWQHTKEKKTNTTARLWVII